MRVGTPGNANGCYVSIGVSSSFGPTAPLSVEGYEIAQAADDLTSQVTGEQLNPSIASTIQVDYYAEITIIVILFE